MYTTILTLHKQGKSQRQIADITGTHRNTVKKIIMRYDEHKIAEPLVYNRVSSVTSFHEQIVTLLSQDLSLVRIFEKLKDIGFKSSYSALSVGTLENIKCAWVVASDFTLFQEKRLRWTLEI